MKIATWNLERPNKSTRKNQAIIECLTAVNPDILILTETHEILDLGKSYHIIHSSKLETTYYKEGERRVSIYSKYIILEEFVTFSNDTAICVKLDTPFGQLVVYGTVIGVHGNRRESFNTDLEKQLEDFERLAPNNNFCIAGDFNMSFSDNYYHTNDGRQKLTTSFERSNLINLTADIKNNIDHIVISKSFIGDRITKKEFWNEDKKSSDHMGVAIELI